MKYIALTFLLAVAARAAPGEQFAVVKRGIFEHFPPVHHPGGLAIHAHQANTLALSAAHDLARAQASLQPASVLVSQAARGLTQAHASIQPAVALAAGAAHGLGQVHAHVRPAASLVYGTAHGLGVARPPIQAAIDVATSVFHEPAFHASGHLAHVEPVGLLNLEGHGFQDASLFFHGGRFHTRATKPDSPALAAQPVVKPAANSLPAAAILQMISAIEGKPATSVVATSDSLPTPVAASIASPAAMRASNNGAVPTVPAATTQAPATAPTTTTTTVAPPAAPPASPAEVVPPAANDVDLSPIARAATAALRAADALQKVEEAIRPVAQLVTRQASSQPPRYDPAHYLALYPSQQVHSSQGYSESF